MERVDIIEQLIANKSMDLLKTLLRDKTTGQYIKWATDNYLDYGLSYIPEAQIKPELIIGNYTSIIQPRVSKSSDEQLKRTREKAEIFTPAWIVNKQNNLIDDIWFERENVFNFVENEKWLSTNEKIVFPKNKTWKDYVDLKRMEMCCGEAPYLVTRYW